MHIYYIFHFLVISRFPPFLAKPFPSSPLSFLPSFLSPRRFSLPYSFFIPHPSSYSSYSPSVSSTLIFLHSLYSFLLFSKAFCSLSYPGFPTSIFFLYFSLCNFFHLTLFFIRIISSTDVLHALQISSTPSRVWWTNDINLDFLIISVKLFILVLFLPSLNRRWGDTILLTALLEWLYILFLFSFSLP